MHAPNLNPAQAILAVLIFSGVENARKRPTTPTPPLFLSYASHYLSLLVAKELLQDHHIGLESVSHKNFNALPETFQKIESIYHSKALQKVETALKKQYGHREIILQQLSATFRRGDLLEMR